MRFNIGDAKCDIVALGSIDETIRKALLTNPCSTEVKRFDRINLAIVYLQAETAEGLVEVVKRVTDNLKKL